MPFSRSHGQLLIWIIAIATVAVLVSTGSVLYSRWRENAVRVSLQISGSNDLKTLAAIVKTPLVLKAALQKPGVQNLAVVQNQRDPEAWLIRTLVVDADHDTRELRLSLRTGLGTDIEETRLLLSVIVDAYREQLARLSREPVDVRISE